MENQSAKNDGIINWINESVFFRLCVIGVLTLILLIPSFLVQDLIQERQNRQEEVIKEISDKWSGSQLVQGPVMVLPYKNQNIYILPDVLNVSSQVNPEVLHRGIFDAVVYSASMQVSGKFSLLELKKSGIDPDQIQWDKVKVVIGLSDLKGLKNNPIIKLADQPYQVEPDFTSLKLFNHNLVILPNLSKERNTALPFSFDLDLKGSTALNFLHLGKSTLVKVEGKWSNPSFTGRYLPEDRQISKAGFSANWKLPFYNRPFPQQWMAEQTIINTVIEGAEKDLPPSIETAVNPDKQTNDAYFGVNFKLPVDQYQKTMRSAKYSILVVLLTFLSLFFTELLYKRKVHLLQYVLIGAAMVIYYTLLLAFSEQVGFNMAYVIASIATVALVSSFITVLLKDKKPALIFGGILSIFYTFIYVIIQLQDLALLFGSVGLFVTVAVLMYLSTRIDWSKER